MEVHLPADLEAFVGEEVASGNYESPESVILAALRALQTDALSLVKADLWEGIRQAEAGEFFDGDIEDVIARAKAEKASRGK